MNPISDAAGKTLENHTPAALAQLYYFIEHAGLGVPLKGPPRQKRHCQVMPSTIANSIDHEVHNGLGHAIDEFALHDCVIRRY